MLNIAHMVDIKPQSGTYVAPIDLKGWSWSSLPASHWKKRF